MELHSYDDFGDSDVFFDNPFGQTSSLEPRFEQENSSDEETDRQKSARSGRSKVRKIS